MTLPCTVWEPRCWGTLTPRTYEFSERRASASKGFRMGRKRQDASANDVLWLQREKEISAVKL